VVNCCDLVFKDADINEHINKIKTQSCWFHTGMADEEFDFCSEKEDYNLWVAGLNWGYTDKGLDLFVEMAKNVNFDKVISAKVEKVANNLCKVIKFNFIYIFGIIYMFADLNLNSNSLLGRIPSSLGLISSLISSNFFSLFSTVFHNTPYFTGSSSKDI
jgi:hypothetical protein